MWKKGLWSIVGGNVWKIVWRHYGKQYGGSSMKNSEGSYQTIQLILLLSIYQKEMKSVSQSSVLLCSLQHYSQLPRYRNKCLLINEWIKKENVRYIYIYISSGILFSLKKVNPATSDNMDEHGGHYAK